MQKPLLLVLALAVLGVAAATSASAAPPPPSVTCVVGGRTSFAHPPKGTDSVSFVYSTLAAAVGSTSWVGGARWSATPANVTSDDFVTATFYNGSVQVGAAEASCS